MAIDSSLFAGEIPAATYAVGDVIPLECIAGPATVRSGRGAAVLKGMTTGVGVAASVAKFAIHIQNSDWIDDTVNIGLPTPATQTSLSRKAGAYQTGHECNLTPNSSWRIWAECIRAGTTTAAVSAWALIDIDYPSVSGVVNPESIAGFPTSIEYDFGSLPYVADGTLTAATWTTVNLDYFKAGFMYCLEKVECLAAPVAFGFIAFSNAAGMGGLQRIIPITTNAADIRHEVNYSSPLVKGPMDVKMLMVAASATTADTVTIHDYVKKRA